VEIPNCPEYLTGHGADQWPIICQACIDEGLLDVSVIPVIEAYCIAYHAYRIAVEKMMADGSVEASTKGGRKTSPASLEARQWQNTMIRRLNDLGLKSRPGMGISRPAATPAIVEDSPDASNPVREQTPFGGLVLVKDAS